jgi:hypothetical protein
MFRDNTVTATRGLSPLLDARRGRLSGRPFWGHWKAGCRPIDDEWGPVGPRGCRVPKQRDASNQGPRSGPSRVELGVKPGANGRRARLQARGMAKPLIAQRIAALLREREANNRALKTASERFIAPPAPELTMTYRGPLGSIDLDGDDEWLREKVRGRRGCRRDGSGKTLVRAGWIVRIVSSVGRRRSWSGVDPVWWTPLKLIF